MNCIYRHGVNRGHAGHARNESVLLRVLIQPVRASPLVQQLRPAADGPPDRPSKIKFCSIFFLKMGQLRPLFHLFSSFQRHITIFTKKINVKNVHPVYSAGIRTHDL